MPPESERKRVIEQVATLWPYLEFKERYDWCNRIAWQDGDQKRWLDVCEEIVWQVGLNHWLADGWLEQDFANKGALYRMRWSDESSQS